MKKLIFVDEPVKCYRLKFLDKVVINNIEYRLYDIVGNLPWSPKILVREGGRVQVLYSLHDEDRWVLVPVNNHLHVGFTYNQVFVVDLRNMVVKVLPYNDELFVVMLLHRVLEEISDVAECEVKPACYILHAPYTDFVDCITHGGDVVWYIPFNKTKFVLQRVVDDLRVFANLSGKICELIPRREVVTLFLDVFKEFEKGLEIHVDSGYVYVKVGDLPWIVAKVLEKWGVYL